jgi:hypothetical protein
MLRMPMRGRPPRIRDRPRSDDMHVPSWLVRLTLTATLALGSAVCAGWKWEYLL